MIWSKQRHWTFVGTAIDPEDHLDSVKFHCSGDYCGLLTAHTNGNVWAHTQQEMLGMVEVYFSVSDPALNVVESRHLDLRIDVAMPTTTLTLNGAVPVAWYSRTVTAELSAVDNGSWRATSGVAQIQYTVDAQSALVHPGAQVTFTMNEEGAHTLSFHAVDVAGNHEPTHTIGFGIDTTLPVAQPPTVVTGSGLGNCVIPTGTVWLDLSARDAGSGVRSLRLSHDGISWSPWRPYVPRVLWQLPHVTEPVLVSFQVQDNVGWRSTPIAHTVLYSPPDVWCTYLPAVQRQ